MAATISPLRLDDAAVDWLALALIDGLTPARAFALVQRFGTPRGVLDASATDLAAAGVTSALVEKLRRARERASAETVALARAGASLVAWSDERYPARLREI